MRWGACLVAALAMATVETANAQSVADTIAQFGLIGTWAADCTQPASSSNYLTVYAIKPSGEVMRTYYDKPGHIYNNYKITSAKRQAPDLLSYEQVWISKARPPTWPAIACKFCSTWRTTNFKSCRRKAATVRSLSKTANSGAPAMKVRGSSNATANERLTRYIALLREPS